MSNSYFEFKQFRLDHENCSMKVGTDGVLLGAWSPVKPGCRVLDIGTGTGLLALMTTQRGAGYVTAVEIDKDAADQAARNVAMSPWADRVSVLCMDILDFKSDVRFDLVICNPPYFRNSLRSPDAGRSTARHDDTLSYEALAGCVSGLLDDDGKLCVILPYQCAEGFIKCASVSDLYLEHRTDVLTVAGKEPKRSLLSFGRSFVPCRTDVLSIRKSDGNESSEYVELVRDFYLRY